MKSTTIFWIEVDKVRSNPYQPRREFNADRLQELADSIRQYGVLQPIVVTRKEIEKDDGGLMSVYELIAGERRLRASKIAGISQIPSIIRTEDDEKLKLEIAIIENLQREDLNVTDRARAFKHLIEKFSFTHAEVAKRVGKSREYVSNTLRLLNLPDFILDALSSLKLSEGHTRPLMMLDHKPAEQNTLFKEIIYKKLTVREAEHIARRIASDRVRKKEFTVDPELLTLEEDFQEALGTRVHIERKEVGGHITIDFFSNNELHVMLDLLQSNKVKKPEPKADQPLAEADQSKKEDTDLYNIKNFRI